MRIPTAIFCILSLPSLGHATSSLLVSYSTTGGGGGVEEFSLTPQSAGVQFDSENAAVTSLTTAGNTAYWATSTQIYSDNLTDTTGGNGKTTLPSLPFGGVTISDLAVDPATNSYFVGWIAPGFGWFIAQYPLSPAGTFNVFVNSTNPVQGLTVVGKTAYWFEGTNIYSQNLDGTGKTLVQSFNLGGVTLNDLGVDPVSQTYILSALDSGLGPVLARYPLTPNASGVLVGFGTNTISGLTIAGDHLYWLDGANVWSENLNGTGLTLQETLPSQFTPTDIAVSLDTQGPSAVPEPASLLLLGCGLIALVLLKRAVSARPGS